jgi:hypothetical protein
LTLGKFFAECQKKYSAKNPLPIKYLLSVLCRVLYSAKNAIPVVYIMKKGRPHVCMASEKCGLDKIYHK